MTIREVNTADAAAIAEIYEHYVRTSDATLELEAPDALQWKARIADITRRHPFLVAYDDNGSLTAYCYCHDWKSFSGYDCTAETTVYVRPGYEHRGIGESLMRCLIDRTRAMRFKTLIACITSTNAPSIALHEKLGFVRVSKFEDVATKHGHDVSIIDMLLRL